MGKITRVALDGKLLWDFEYNGSNFITHHSIIALPNGNVILTVYDELTPTEAAAVGRDTATVRRVFRPDRLVEIEQTGPTTGVVVWDTTWTWTSNAAPLTIQP